MLQPVTSSRTAAKRSRSERQRQLRNRRKRRRAVPILTPAVQACTDPPPPEQPCRSPSPVRTPISREYLKGRNVIFLRRPLRKAVWSDWPPALAPRSPTPLVEEPDEDILELHPAQDDDVLDTSTDAPAPSPSRPATQPPAHDPPSTQHPATRVPTRPQLPKATGGGPLIESPGGRGPRKVRANPELRDPRRFTAVKRKLTFAAPRDNPNRVRYYVTNNFPRSRSASRVNALREIQRRPRHREPTRPNRPR